jgi:DNA-binding GntR family transcriptional regulator
MPRDENPEGDPYNLTMPTTADWQTGSMVDEIAEILRERIVEGRLAPQEQLTQRRLAEDLSVTRGLAARHAGPGTHRRCQEALDDHRAAIHSGDRLRSMRADISFHGSLVDGSGNPVLRSHWLLVRFTTRSAVLLTPAQLSGSIEEHEAILDAVSRGEAEQAERAARAHVRATIDALEQISPLHDSAREARSP